jgi:hypothetical protein
VSYGKNEDTPLGNYMGFSGYDVGGYWIHRNMGYRSQSLVLEHSPSGKNEHKAKKRFEI